MSESQQGPEMCDVISRKRYYIIDYLRARLLKFGQISFKW